VCLYLKGIIDVRIELDDKDSSLLMKKDYEAAKAIDITDNILVLDPSMPRKKISCDK
jgi:DNA-directed RNA polymerase II subunit RPB9